MKGRWSARVPLAALGVRALLSSLLLCPTHREPLTNLLLLLLGRVHFLRQAQALFAVGFGFGLSLHNFEPFHLLWRAQLEGGLPACRLSLPLVQSLYSLQDFWAPSHLREQAQSSYRLNELAVVYELPLVLDLIGCYPCLDLVPQPLKWEKQDSHMASGPSTTAPAPPLPGTQQSTLPVPTALRTQVSGPPAPSLEAS